MVGYNKHHLAKGVREGRGPDVRRNIVRGTGRPVRGRSRKASEKAAAPKRLDEAEQQKNKEAMLTKEEDLVFMSPLIDGYALKNKLWRKCTSVCLGYAHGQLTLPGSLILCRGCQAHGLE